MRRFRPQPPRPGSNGSNGSSRPSRPAADEAWLLPLPVPDAREGGESTWALWHEAAQQLEDAFAQTEPSDVAPLLEAREAPAAPQPSHRLTTDTLMLVARRNNRVCPRAEAWTTLYRLLEGERYLDLQPPPLPIWTKLSHLQKRLRFRETLAWAERHGKLDVAARFMVDLEEDDWLHMG